MPRFGSFLTKINEKLEEAKISDLNHELGKWVQGSHAYLGHFKSDAANVGSRFKAESHRLGGRIWSKNAAGSSGSSGGGLPKSLSLPSFSSALSPPSKTPTAAASRDPRRKYRYKSSGVGGTQANTHPESFFDEVDEDLLKGADVDLALGISEIQTKSDVVEKFIRVIENRDSAAESSLPVPSQPQVTSPPNTRREDIRKKLAGFGESSEKEAKRQQSKEAKKGNDLEVCYINETILEEDDEYEEDEGADQPEYHYEEDYRSAFPPAPLRSHLPRSKTDWEAFRGLDDSVEDQPYSSASPYSSPRSSPGARSPDKPPAAFRPDIQSEAAVALANCPRIARRKFLLLKQKQLENEENQLEKLLGKKIPRDQEGHFTEDSLSNLNTPTLQVIVNDLHSKIEGLNDQLVKLVIEKDELQIEQDSQLVDIDDLQVPQRRN